MESVKYLKEYILAAHPVRKTAGQKESFRRWAMAELKRAGWKAREETYGKLNGSVNLVAGDPDKATVFLCAHYDTASRMLLPNFISPTNVLVHICYHLLCALALVVLALALSFAVSYPLNQPGLMLPLFLIFAVVLLWVNVYGPANKQNANSNSSGVAALLAAAGAMTHDKRVCLVLLDNSEKDLLGASAFKKKHVSAAANCLFINLDCVGDGEHMLFMPSKHSRWDAELLDALEKAFPASGGIHPHVLSKGLNYYPSDHRKFKFHVAVCACRRLTGLGYYIPRLRTRLDTVLEEENIDYLAQGLARFVPLYLDRSEEDE